MTDARAATRRLVFDIEANGLVDLELTGKGEPKTIADRIHCICAVDCDTGEQFSFGPNDMEEAIALLDNASMLIGHNIISYDLRILDRILDWRPLSSVKLFDTLLVGRLMYPDRTNLPLGLNSHSLRDWSQFAGSHKDDYNGGWEEFSQEMLDYCLQDVVGNRAVAIKQGEFYRDNQPLIQLETTVAQLCCEMADNGWGFDLDRAVEYEQQLTLRSAELEDALRAAFPTITEERWSEKTGKRLKDKVTIFNPGSSKQWAERLADKYGWVPELTDSGNPIVDEVTLTNLSYPEAALGLEYRDINKKRGMLADWILRCEQGTGVSIHGRTNSQGTATGRASHSQPNLAQVPSDSQCRELFGPRDAGWTLVGCDLSGIELRCLAHYMKPFDGGAYAKEILEGDIHTANQNAAGLPTRNHAKTFIYALIYGAGDGKIGSIVEGNARDGSTLKKKFFTALPALEKLIEKAQYRARKIGKLKMLDGRACPVRQVRTALNTLLQGAGAILSKYWLVEAKRLLELNHPGLYRIHGWIHDELQVSCPPDIADSVGGLLVQAALTAGDQLGFSMPMDAEYSHGKDWSCTH